MSNNDQNQAPSTLQPMVIIFGILLALVIVYSFIFGKPIEEVAAPVATVAANIKPEAAVEVAPVAVANAEKSGEDVVKASCAMCHETGMMNSPKLGDAAQWEPRIAQGYETLVKHAIEGVRTMPAKGGNPALTDGEVAAAVAVMANQVGAKFDPATLAKK